MAALQSLKTGKNFEVFTDGTQKLIRIDNVRVSFPAFGKKKEDEDEAGNKHSSWQAVPMLSKKDHVEAKDAFVEIMNELMKTNEVKIPPEYRCIKNGDDKDREEYQGHWVISASDSNRRPAARDQRGGLILDEDEIDEKFYGGCYVNILLRPWFFSGKSKKSPKTYPKRICCGLVGVQFNHEGDPFGNGRIDDTDVWGAVSNNSNDDGFGGSASEDDDDGL